MTIKKILINEEIQFYTFTPKEQRPKTLILKGISGDYTEENILEELKEKAGQDVTIKNFKKIIFNKKDPDNYYYMVQINQDNNSKNITQINALSSQKIKWEHIRKKKMFQCKRCQRIGHASVNCHLPYRCVKCAQSHEPGKCEIKKDDDKSELKCANCEQTGHPASYQGCPFLKFTAYQIKSQAENNKQKTFDSSKALRTNKSYSQTVHSSAGQNNNTQDTHIPNYTNNLKNEIIKEIMNQLVSTIDKSLNKLIEKINTNEENIRNIIKCLDINNE